MYGVAKLETVVMVGAVGINAIMAETSWWMFDWGGGAISLLWHVWMFGSGLPLR